MSGVRSRYPYEQRLMRGIVTVRVPRVLLKCKVMAGAAVTLMVVGTLTRSPELRAWALLISVLAAALCVGASVRRATEHMKAWIKTWVLETHENALRQGIEMGREMEAAERLVDYAHHIQKN